MDQDEFLSIIIRDSMWKRGWRRCFVFGLKKLENKDSIAYSPWKIRTMDSYRSFSNSAKHPTTANGIVDPYDPSLEWKAWYVNITKRIVSSLRDVQAMAVMQRQVGRFKVS